jgi:hypothetical protein
MTLILTMKNLTPHGTSAELTFAGEISANDGRTLLIFYPVMRRALSGIAKQVALELERLTGRRVSAGYLRSFCRPCPTNNPHDAVNLSEKDPTGEVSPLERFVCLLIALHRVAPHRARCVFAFVEAVFNRLEMRRVEIEQPSEREIIAEMTRECAEAQAAMLLGLPETEQELLEALGSVRRSLIFRESRAQASAAGVSCAGVRTAHAR